MGGSYRKIKDVLLERNRLGFCIWNLCGRVMHMRQECTCEARRSDGPFFVSQIIKDVYISYNMCVFQALHMPPQLVNGLARAKWGLVVGRREGDAMAAWNWKKESCLGKMIECQSFQSLTSSP